MNNDRLRLQVTLLTDDELVESLEKMAVVEEIWSHDKRAALVHEAARRITDMRSVIDDARIDYGPQFGEEE